MIINLPGSLGSIKISRPEIASKVNQSILAIQKILNFDDSFFPIPQVDTMKKVCKINLDLIINSCVEYKKIPKENVAAKLKVLSFVNSAASTQLGQINEFIQEIEKRKEKWYAQEKILIQFDQLLIFDAIENMEILKINNPGYFDLCLQEFLDFIYCNLSLPPKFPSREDLYISFNEDPFRLISFLEIIESQTAAFRKIIEENKVSLVFVEYMNKTEVIERPEASTLLELDAVVEKSKKLKKPAKAFVHIRSKEVCAAKKEDVTKDFPEQSSDMKAILRDQLLIENLLSKIDKAKRKIREMIFSSRVSSWRKSADEGLDVRKKEKKSEIYTDEELIASHFFPKEIFLLIFNDFFSRESSWLSPTTHEVHGKKECLITVDNEPKLLEATIDTRGVLYHFSARDLKEEEKEWARSVVLRQATEISNEEDPFIFSMRGFTLDENLNVLIDHDGKKIVVYRLHD